MDIQEEIKHYLEERKWNNFTPADLAKSVSIEAAELLENFQWSNPSRKDFVEDKDKALKVKREVADVIIYSIEMCILLDINFQDVVREKLEFVRKKYPVANVIGKDDSYFKIKEEYRRKGKN